ncbi:motility associated factor glycosyltransferase family protein [Fontibacillus sp. BL9]|uniref:motility associated factor glycosyltransferase family protein n=1 Tax=Fontibacillus sp. BL9 TaxID=3389971 RepID=UPI003979D529
MSVYNLNIEYITKNYPGLLDALEGDVSAKESHELVYTKSNEPNLKITQKEKSYILHSRYNAKDEAIKWVDQNKELLETNKHILLFGLGLGYYTDEFLATTTATDIYIVEPSISIFRELLNTKDIRSFLADPRIRMFAVGDNEILTLQIAGNVSTQVSESFSCIYPPVYRRLYPSILEDLESKIRDLLLSQASNIQTAHVYQSTWLKNTFNNLLYLLENPSIGELGNIFEGKDVRAIIVGSGPSLKKDIHYLHHLKDKCLIIAAGSSIQALKHYGLTPHFVVGIDGSLANYEVFKNISGLKVPLLFGTQINNKILQEYCGDLYSLKFTNDTVIEYLIDTESKIPAFYSTSTVTGTAIQIAAYLGITEIILMGQDLSYSDDEYYAPGVNHVSEEKKSLTITKANEWVDNVEGGKNRTIGSMQVLLKDIQVLVALMSLEGVKFTNTSKKGAVIKGTNWAAMDDLAPKLLQLPSYDFNILNRITPISANEKLDKTNELVGKLQKLTNKIDKMDLKIKKLIDVFEKLDKAISRKNITQTDKALTEINKIWGWITKQEVFTIFYSYALEQHLNVYKRFIPQIVEATNSFEKGNLIIKHLGNLIFQFKKFNPELIELTRTTAENFSNTLETLEKISNL